MFDKHFVGLNLTGIEDNGTQRPISRVTLRVDDENSVTAGDDTGMELLTDCPHATQEMASAILAQVKGYRYRMFSADGAALDPAAELGDGVTAGGVYAVISRLSEDGSGYAGIAAPGEAELEDEFPAGGPLTTSFNRKIAQTYSRITKTAEQIRLEVANDLQGLSSSITVDLNKINLKVDDAEKGVSQLSQTVSGFEATVKNLQSGLSQTLKIAADGVTITNASGSRLVIDGGQLKANSITVDKLAVESLTISKVYDRSGKKTAIDCSSADTMYIGGNSSINRYSTLLIKGGVINFSDWGDAKNGISIKSSTSYYIRPETSNIYTLGDSTHAWSECYTCGVTIVPANSSLSGMTIGVNGIIPDKNEHMNLGSSTYSWNFLYVYGITMGGVRLYPGRVSYDNTIYATMDSDKSFCPRNSTGYSIGSNVYTWESGYFKKLYINGKELSNSELKNEGYKVSLSTAPALAPATNNTYSLGSSSYYWKNAYVSTLYLSSSCYISAGSASTIKVGTTTIGSGASKLENGTYSVSLNTSGVLSPKASASYNLGSSSYYWKYLYVQRIYLQYNSYTSLYLTCNSSSKLCVNGTAIH